MVKGGKEYWDRQLAPTAAGGASKVAKRCAIRSARSAHPPNRSARAPKRSASRPKPPAPPLKAPAHPTARAATPIKRAADSIKRSAGPLFGRLEAAARGWLWAAPRRGWCGDATAGAAGRARPGGVGPAYAGEESGVGGGVAGLAAAAVGDKLGVAGGNAPTSGMRASAEIGLRPTGGLAAKPGQSTAFRRIYSARV